MKPQHLLLSLFWVTIGAFAQQPPPPPAAAAPPGVHEPKPLPAPRKPEDASTPAIKDRPRHDLFLERIKEGDINLIFMGDSIMDRWPRNGEKSWLELAPYQPADFGIGGDRTEHVLWRINNGELDGVSPKGMVLMIGTNNVAADKPEWIAAGIKKIIDTVHEKTPKTKILLLGVFPRGKKDSPWRAAITQINALISKFGDGDKTQYLDIGSVFLDGDGEIPADVMPDQLHPSEKGYDLWYKAMAPALEKLMK